MCFSAFANAVRKMRFLRSSRMYDWITWTTVFGGKYFVSFFVSLYQKNSNFNFTFEPSIRLVLFFSMRIIYSYIIVKSISFVTQFFKCFWALKLFWCQIWFWTRNYFLLFFWVGINEYPIFSTIFFYQLNYIILTSIWTLIEYDRARLTYLWKNCYFDVPISLN